MEKNDKEAMGTNQKTVTTDHEPEINYRGWKAMPFIIGSLETAFCLLHASLSLSFP